MRTYVSPIGYNSTSVVRPVLSRGLDTGDEIVLLRPETETDDNRASEAVADVKRVVTEIEPKVSVSVERLRHDDYAAAVLRCVALLNGFDGEVIVNFAGGPRDLLLPLTTAALVHHDAVETALSFSDIDGAVRDLDLPVVTAAIPDNTIPTFEAILAHDDSVSITKLADETSLSKSSITRHVQRLDSAGLVRTVKHGKTKLVERTFTARLHAQVSNG